ncbi:Cytochrome c oxidase subunit 4, mitochondrial [Neolecta irregularis DAH-3]|uniref:Cytochrome c oxidase subunit 4, mitochondrial n=1 Tax=Neolecta irregularis (strain DAH-3) TaxID=1198029 RepID=A0A1U7LSU3_NEOID|nr:Cytochrome c oxidase subunit 4, mitochondrial [Neolecta irregularis DAH-3]|eukprot:OLL25653.1 Cytochrome c oxidase subunit 4, mitochondrial [Neolecta irregularis DAH-3]
MLVRCAIRKVPIRRITPRHFSTSINPFKDSNEVSKSSEYRVLQVPEEQLEAVGALPGTVPTNIEQATGLERAELLGKLHGVDIFNMKPLEVNRLGTMKDPIPVDSFYKRRFVGCTGYPVDSHDTLWLDVREEQVGRCPECGCVYNLNFIDIGVEGHQHDHPDSDISDYQTGGIINGREISWKAYH